MASNVSLTMGNIIRNGNTINVPITVTFLNGAAASAKVLPLAVLGEAIGNPMNPGNQVSAPEMIVANNGNPSQLNPAITLFGPGAYTIHAVAIDDTNGPGNGAHVAKFFNY
jgi:hypothetical protein